ncbi:hypothetical protein PV11_00230 [Exophiala sideris]|uniref:Uncharacterized protein n=1 Tax=Exophiala sideris TaxID=1016849 RepID=A0A0D1YSP2_9EURO|nr:hypothetical protein PV11_00230 [Exophiala sideris]
MSSSGGALPDEVIVLLCILGAAATTCLGYAVQRHFAKEDFEGASFNQKSPSQEAYMREPSETPDLREDTILGPPTSKQQADDSLGDTHTYRASVRMAQVMRSSQSQTSKQTGPLAPGGFEVLQFIPFRGAGSEQAKPYQVKRRCSHAVAQDVDCERIHVVCKEK